MAGEDFPKIGPGAPAPAPQGLIGRVLGVAVGAVVLVAALLFSVVVFAVLLAAGVIVGGYLWWRTRALRRQLRAQMQAMEEQMRARQGTPGGAHPPGARDETVIDGDFIRETDRDPRPPRA